MGESRQGVSRRKFLKTVAAGAAGAGVLALAGQAISTAGTEAAEPFDKPGNHNLAWVWQFDDDGSPEQIRSQLAFLGMGILLKSHDATTYMAKWDKSGSGIDGAAKIRELRDFFESGGVPFHAWAVVKGQDPIGEAHMAAEVLANGARSVVFDLEPSDGGSFWQGTPDSALRFGEELRSIARNGFLSVAPDPRPWQVEAVPCREFATFCNEVAPQAYWPMFNNSATYRMLRERGYDVPPEGITPDGVIDMTARVFAGYTIPVKPVGAGNATVGEWERFVGRAHEYGMAAVSMWRFGTARPEVWDVFRRARPLYDAYYGPDWQPAIAGANGALTSFPSVAAPTTARGVVLQKEATSAVQGVSLDLDQKAKGATLDTSVKRADTAKKSFWADAVARR